MSESPPEKTPGVYVKTGDRYPNELDVLWSGVRQYNREERSPLIFVGMGLTLGIAVTCAVFLLILKSPEVTVGENTLTETIIDDTNLVPKVEETTTSLPTEPAVQTTEASTTPAQNPLPEPAPVITQKEAPKPPPSLTLGTYTVRNGDTLEIIARRYYGSGAPKYIRQIQNANNIKNPHAIYIGQKLTIPSKSY